MSRSFSRDRVELAVLRGGDPVDSAVSAMRKLRQHAVIVEVAKGDLRLFSNREVLDAWAAGVEVLAEVPVAGRPAVTPLRDRSGHVHEVSRDLIGDRYLRVESAAAQVILERGAAGVTVDFVDHRLAAEFASWKGLCRCRCGNRENSPPAEDGQDCPECGRELRCC